MSVGINDNISRLYQSQQVLRQATAQNNADVKPVETSDKSEKMKKAGVGLFAALGVVASLALLAKFDKSKNYTINPLKMFRGKLKDSFLFSTKYNTAKVVSIGAGSILGGLAGGAILDDKKNFKSKLREGIVQIANITFPIALVEALSSGGTMLAGKLMPKWCESSNLFKQAVTKLPAAAGAMAGLLTGMYIGNKCSNKLNEKLFNKKDDRPIKYTDFSAHVDDIGVAATFVAPDNIVTKAVSRLIPAALVVAGYETGIKKETDSE
ncbi:MAG: hypothetical protein K6E29_01620 [Cyanobacteria bacterium RUI128]|nr:hypothetical protein [Cyanobacteria bacterium RUI128]